MRRIMRCEWGRVWAWGGVRDGFVAFVAAFERRLGLRMRYPEDGTVHIRPVTAPNYLT